LCTPLRKQNGWFAQGMSVTQFVEDVRIYGSYLGNNNLCLFDLSLNVLKHYSRASLLVYAEHFESGCLRLLLITSR